MDGIVLAVEAWFYLAQFTSLSLVELLLSKSVKRCYLVAWVALGCAYKAMS